MPKEAVIRKKAVEILEKEGFVYWYPAKVRFKQNDIFGIFDLVCWRRRTPKVKFLQLTTLPNFSTRRKKIKSFLKKNRLSQKRPIEIEIWGWNNRTKEFRRESV